MNGTQNAVLYSPTPFYQYIVVTHIHIMVSVNTLTITVTQEFN